MTSHLDEAPSVLALAADVRAKYFLIRTPLIIGTTLLLEQVEQHVFTRHYN